MSHSGWKYGDAFDLYLAVIAMHTLTVPSTKFHVDSVHNKSTHKSYFVNINKNIIN